MKYITILTIVYATIFFTQTEHRSGDELKGHWTIDLRPAPMSEGYYQTFEVLNIENNSFTGSFYGSKISHGLINTRWDRIYFAFTTSDQSNKYYHSGYLENGKLFGQSYCPSRSFTSPWKGTRQKK